MGNIFSTYQKQVQSDEQIHEEVNKKPSDTDTVFEDLPNQQIQLYECTLDEESNIIKDLQSNDVRYQFFKDIENPTDPNVESLQYKWFFEIFSEDIKNNQKYVYVKGFININLQMTYNLNNLTAAFLQNDESVKLLKFQKKDQLISFYKEYNDKQFENQFDMENTEENKKQIFDEFLDQYDDIPMDYDFPEQYKPRSSYINKDIFYKDDIKILETGLKNRSYVIGKNNIQVLKNTEYSIEDINQNIKLNFNPSKFVLNSNNKQARLLDPQQKTSVFQLDLQRQNVVNKYNLQKHGVDIPISDVKNPQKTYSNDNNLFFTVDSNRLSKWDQRTKEGVVEFISGQDNVKKPDFTCMQTSDNGFIVVGDKTGSVRLYKQNVLSRAAKKYPSLGQSISNIDISFDSEMILATYDKFLLLIQKNLPSKILKLNYQDILKIGLNYKFQNAHFSWEEKPQKITVNSNSYTIIFDIQEINNNQFYMQNTGIQTVTDFYEIYKNNNEIIDNIFTKHKPKNDILVATKNNVFQYDQIND